MSTVEETATQKDRRVVYIVITVALVLLPVRARRRPEDSAP